jgi:DNA-binding NarL/FixJ family response regulator
MELPLFDETALARLRENLGLFESRSASFGHALERFRARRRGNAQCACPLTRREVAILRLIADGRENAEIADELHFGVGTIKLHVREILHKLGASTRTEAAVLAVRKGYI